MEDIGEFISLREAARQAPGRPHTSAVWRWCRKGIKTRRGDRIHLKHVRVGGRIFTRANWLLEFFDSVAQADVEYFASQHKTELTAARPRTRTEAERRRAIAEAEAQLKEAGI